MQRIESWACWILQLPVAEGTGGEGEAGSGGGDGEADGGGDGEAEGDASIGGEGDETLKVASVMAMVVEHGLPVTWLTCATRAPSRSVRIVDHSELEARFDASTPSEPRSYS